MKPKTIVISGVNIRRGGTLRILRDCLAYLSTLARKGDYKVVAIVHRRGLADFPGIRYIEMPDVAKGWTRRLWCEYMTMHKISLDLAPVYLWLSLHDTTPRVEAERQAMYCQTSFPFMKTRLSDLVFGFKIAVFSCFTRFAYQINVSRNRDIIVQARWLKDGLSRLLGVDRDKFIICPPQEEKPTWPEHSHSDGPYRFVYVAIADCHKNIETLCKATEILENEIGPGKFRVSLTIDGSENSYAAWIVRKWGELASLDFIGYQSREGVDSLYRQSDCLVFPSRIETWGLPISEFKSSGKPMLLADLPYAHEASAGSPKVAFFNPEDPTSLAAVMGSLAQGNSDLLQPENGSELDGRTAASWEELFDALLN